MVLAGGPKVRITGSSATARDMLVSVNRSAEEQVRLPAGSFETMIDAPRGVASDPLGAYTVITLRNVEELIVSRAEVGP